MQREDTYIGTRIPHEIKRKFIEKAEAMNTTTASILRTYVAAIVNIDVDAVFPSYAEISEALVHSNNTLAECEYLIERLREQRDTVMIFTLLDGFQKTEGFKKLSKEQKKLYHQHLQHATDRFIDLVQSLQKEVMN